MDLDSRGHHKLITVSISDVNFGKYRNILEALYPLSHRYDHETPEMWASRIRDPFRKILKEGYSKRILSGNGFIIMCGKLHDGTEEHGYHTNYIYCNVCDSLVFIPDKYPKYRDNHLRRCISGNTISDGYTSEILESINRKEFKIWQYKQYMLQEEAKINRLRLELFSQSTSHSERDKIASVSYVSDCRLTSYEAYEQAKASMAHAKNTMPSAPNFEPAYISNTEREIISYHQKFGTLNESTPPPLSRKPVALMGGMNYPMQRSASAPEIRNLWSNRSNMPNIPSSSNLGNIAEAYFDSVRKVQGDRLDRP